MSGTKSSLVTKNLLKKIVNIIEIPKCIVCYDCWEASGRNIVWSIVKSHLKDGRDIYYLCYSISPETVSRTLSFEGKERIKFHDVFSDPLHWVSNTSEIPKGSSSFMEILSLSEDAKKKNFVIVIDKIDCALKYLSETTIIRNLQKLKSAACVMQVIILCSGDVCSQSFVDALSYTCFSSLKVKPSLPLECEVLLKKSNGKVCRNNEYYSINSKYELESLGSVSSKQTGKIDHQTDDSAAAFETTFNLSLTEDQKEAKNKLILPHTRIQSTGGLIHYVPDADDDWDDEDPDDDLEI